MQYALVAHVDNDIPEFNVVEFEDVQILHDGLDAKFAFYSIIEINDDIRYIKALAWDISKSIAVINKLKVSQQFSGLSRKLMDKVNT